MFFLQLCGLLGLAIAVANGALTVDVCDEETGHLTCGTGIIKIIDGNYGRLDNSTCAGDSAPQNLTDLSCRAPNSLATIQNLCDDETTCTLTPDSDQFGGDPCPNTNKYITVDYECLVKPTTTTEMASTTREQSTTSVQSTNNVQSTTVTVPVATTPKPDNSTVRACLKDILALKCSKGKLINIVDVQFGRQDDDVCCFLYTKKNYKCDDSAIAHKQICGQCQSKGSCSIKPHRLLRSSCSLIGKPYLSVTYHCLDKC